MKQKNEIFATYHPVGLFLYFISVILITMFSTNPVMLSIALIFGMLFILVITDLKKFLKGLAVEIPFILVITVTNPLFSHNGVTVLFFLNGNPVTLEAILYGMDIGVMIFAVIYWCKAYNAIIDDEKFIYIFGKTIPKLSLVMSMALKYVPMLKRQYMVMNDARKCMGCCNEDTLLDRVKNKLTVFSMLVTWSFETSLDTAVSMKVKGYGLKGRTHFHNFRFGYRDAILIIITVIMDVVVLWGMTTGVTDFKFYPEILKNKVTVSVMTVYVSFAILMSIPAFIEIKEKIKWKYYVEKI